MGRVQKKSVKSINKTFMNFRSHTKTIWQNITNLIFISNTRQKDLNSTSNLIEINGSSIGIDKSRNIKTESSKVKNFSIKNNVNNSKKYENSLPVTPKETGLYIESDHIVDNKSDITIDSKDKSPSGSSNITISSCDNIQIDEEITQQIIAKPTDFATIEKRLEIHKNTLKREYNNPLFNKKILRNQNPTNKLQLRPIIIDGLNIGHTHGHGTFSVKGINLCIQYFSNRGHEKIIAFIPIHRQGIPGSESNTILNILYKKGHICYTPSRKVQNLRMTCYDDRIILDYAHRCGGVVVSNDNYRDLYKEKKTFKDIIENRQVMITFVNDEIIVPDDQYNTKSDTRSLSDILCFPAK